MFIIYLLHLKYPIQLTHYLYSIYYVSRTFIEAKNTAVIDMRIPSIIDLEWEIDTEMQN